MLLHFGVREALELEAEEGPPGGQRRGVAHAHVALRRYCAYAYGRMGTSGTVQSTGCLRKEYSPCTEET